MEFIANIRKSAVLLLLCVAGCMHVDMPNIVYNEGAEITIPKNLAQAEICNPYLFGIVSIGSNDMGVMSIARKGRIKKVTYVDTTYEWYLVVIKKCVRVFGEPADSDADAPKGVSKKK
jgi:hypothetical protein